MEGRSEHEECNRLAARVDELENEVDRLRFVLDDVSRAESAKLTELREQVQQYADARDALATELVRLGLLAAYADEATRLLHYAAQGLAREGVGPAEARASIAFVQSLTKALRVAPGVEVDPVARARGEAAALNQLAAIDDGGVAPPASAHS